MILERIKHLCKLNNTNIGKLEETLGFGKGTIYKWDTSAPTVWKLLEVAKYFKVSIMYFLEDDNKSA